MDIYSNIRDVPPCAPPELISAGHHSDAPTAIKAPRALEPMPHQPGPGELSYVEEQGRAKLTLAQRATFDQHFKTWGRFGDALSAALQGPAGIYPNLSQPRLQPVGSSY